MNPLDVDIFPAPGVARLPWQWFEFRSPPQKVEPGPLRRALDEPLELSAGRVWQVDVAGSAMQFKLFRQKPPQGKSRPLLLLLHGMGLNIASFRGVSPSLLATHDLVLPDYSAMCADAGPTPGEASLSEFVAGVWRIADALGADTLALAGSSMGGGLALLAALQHPARVRKILLSNPAVFPQELPSMYRLVRYPIVGEVFMTVMPAERFIGGLEYIGYVDKGRFDPALRANYVSMMARRRGRLRLMQLIRTLPANAGDAWPARHLSRLHELTQPVLISWGMQDVLLAAGAGERLAAAMPHAVFDRHEDLAHLPHEEAPERIGQRWAQFLNEES